MPEEPSYTLDEARALIPQVRAVLLQLAIEKRRFDDALGALHAEHAAHATAGSNGSHADVEAREAALAQVGEGIKGLLHCSNRWGCRCATWTAAWWTFRRGATASARGSAGGSPTRSLLLALDERRVREPQAVVSRTPSICVVGDCSLDVGAEAAWADRSRWRPRCLHAFWPPAGRAPTSPCASRAAGCPFAW